MRVQGAQCCILFGIDSQANNLIGTILSRLGWGCMYLMWLVNPTLPPKSPIPRRILQCSTTSVEPGLLCTPRVSKWNHRRACIVRSSIIDTQLGAEDGRPEKRGVGKRPRYYICTGGPPRHGSRVALMEGWDGRLGREKESHI